MNPIGRLAVQVGRAADGLVKLARFDPAWRSGFSLSWVGAAQSYLARFAGLPPYLLFVASLSRGLAEARPGKHSVLWPEALGFLLDAVAFPLAIALLSRLLGIARGFPGFLAVVNWTSFFLNLLLGAASLLAFGGETGIAVFGLVWFILAGLAIYLTWRAAQETLTEELGPVILIVLLSIASGVFADQAAGWLAGES